eukprot:416385_1
MAAVIAFALLIVHCIASFQPKVNDKHLTVSDLGPPHRHQIINKVIGLSLHGIENPLNKVSINGLPVVYITDFGGDPTGVNDSTSAFEAAISEALKKGAPNTYLSNNIKDCGGVTIDLAGGDYLVSKPVTIPQMYGNLRIIHGTIRASQSFTPKNGALVTIGGETCTNDQKSCNENIGIENMMLDCKNICGTALLVQTTMGTVIGPQIFVLGFQTAGIRISGGHEAMIFNAWLAQYLYSDSRRAHANATAVQFFGNDHYITNTIIFGGKIAVHVTGGANVIEGVHCWNLGTSYGGIGMLIETQSVRMLGNYLDYNDIILTAPMYMMSVINTFFLGGGKLVLKANSANSEIQSLNFIDSQYAIGNSPKNYSTIALDETNGKFKSINNLVMNGIEVSLYQWENGLGVSRYKYKSSNAKKQLTLKNSQSWFFDFSDVLIFGDDIGIQELQYSLNIESTSKNKFVQSAASINNRTVTIETDQPCDATVFVSVDQSTHDN